MAKNTCIVDGCERPVHVRGWCVSHYERWLRWGDPLWTRQLEAERVFWEGVTKTPDGCWLVAHPRNEGYGTFMHIGAHRYALEQALGRPLLPGMFALHVCDVRACVRNDTRGFHEINGVSFPTYGHLFEGTHHNNMTDSSAKGRRPVERNGSRTHPEKVSRGMGRYNSAFTDDQVREIRFRYDNGETQTELAKEFGVRNTTIHVMVHRKSWKHVV